MVEGNHWDQWFSDGFEVRQPSVTMGFNSVHHWSDDGMVMYHRRSLRLVNGFIGILRYFFPDQMMALTYAFLVLIFLG